MKKKHRMSNCRSRSMTDIHTGRLREFMLDQLLKFEMATGWARSTIGMYLVGNPRIYEKLLRGGLTIGSCDKLLGRMQEAVEHHNKHGSWPDAQS